MNNLSMKTFKLKAQRVSELGVLIDQITPKDLATFKDIRLASKIAENLKSAAKELTDKQADLGVKQQDLLKAEGIRERFIEESKDMNEEEKDALGKKLDVEFQTLANEKFAAELAELNVLANAEAEVEMSDEAHAKLKEFFEKFCITQYRVKDALIEVADALEIE